MWTTAQNECGCSAASCAAKYPLFGSSGFGFPGGSPEDNIEHISIKNYLYLYTSAFYQFIAWKISLIGHCECPPNPFTQASWYFQIMNKKGQIYQFKSDLFPFFYSISWVLATSPWAIGVNTSPSSPGCTCMRSPGLKFPESTSIAKGSCSSRWIARFRGRAPKSGS